MGAYKACSRCGRIHPYDQPCPMKKPAYRYERTGADRLRFTSRWKRKSLQVRDDARWMCEVCRDRGKVTTEGLEVHHIEKLRDDPDGLIEDGNLVCLCRMHHRMAGCPRTTCDGLRPRGSRAADAVYRPRLDDIGERVGQPAIPPCPVGAREASRAI